VMAVLIHIAGCKPRSRFAQVFEAEPGRATATDRHRWPVNSLFGAWVAMHGVHLLWLLALGSGALGCVAFSVAGRGRLTGSGCNRLGQLIVKRAALWLHRGRPLDTTVFET
jgi:hypothetical protein